MIDGFNHELNRSMVTLTPGERIVTNRDVVVSTLLGSCVSVILFDSVFGIGGLNHFLVPRVPESRPVTEQEAGRYGETALPRLLDEMRYRGARHFRAKIIGGGCPGGDGCGPYEVASMNVDFARRFLAMEGIAADASDVGGPWSRRILFRPTRGTIIVTRIGWRQPDPDETAGYVIEQTPAIRQDQRFVTTLTSF